MPAVLEMAKMKVWGGTMQVYNLPLPGQPKHNRQARVIVAAPTKKRALELLNHAEGIGPLTLGYMNSYMAQSGNARELALAATGEGVWYTPDAGPNRGEWMTVPKRAVPRPSNYGKGPTVY